MGRLFAREIPYMGVFSQNCRTWPHLESPRCGAAGPFPCLPPMLCGAVVAEVVRSGGEATPHRSESAVHIHIFGFT